MIGQDGQTVSVYKISCRSVKWMLRYGDFSIFQYGGHPILDVWNFKIVMVEKFKRAKLRHCAIFRADRSNCYEVCQFFYFQDGGHPILHFHILEILTVGTLKKAKLCHRAKFRQNRSKYGRDMAIYQFLKMAAATILDFQILEILTVGTLNRAKLRHHAKFLWNRSRRGDFSIFQYF